MNYELIEYGTRNRVATITLNRPERLNALTDQMEAELRDAYATVEQDPDVWITIITGSGRALCAGRDVGTMKGATDRKGPTLQSMREWEAPQEGTPPYLQSTKPILCAVNGICCGAGLDFVSCSDIVIASETASFFDPHVTIGIVSGREMVRMARVLPVNVAMRMALIGRHERMPAQRAYELGLVSELVPADRLLERANEIADLINLNAPLAVRGTRMGIRKGLTLPIYEAELLAESFRLRVAGSEDALEGPRAFVEGRAPDWQGR